MAAIIKRSLKILLRTVLYVAGFFVCYIIAGLLIPFLPVNKHAGKSGTYTVYLLSNGVHMDIVLPVRNGLKDWTKELSFSHTRSKDSLAQYVGFGWGDKGFYLETPTWADLKASTAFKAMFALSTSAMHVTYHREMATGSLCRKIKLNAEQYQQLVAYIGNSFQRSPQGSFMYIPGHWYGEYDGFYEAKGTYSLFHTCNTWANNGLKAAHLKACLWTPLDKGILYQYRDNN